LFLTPCFGLDGADVTDAVATARRAGVIVRMVTGDNIQTAKAIARQCGILTEGGVAVEGPALRRMTPAQLDAILPDLQASRVPITRPLSSPYLVPI
jgi:magnesium-transporting ATPase (P-type)